MRGVKEAGFWRRLKVKRRQKRWRREETLAGGKVERNEKKGMNQGMQRTMRRKNRKIKS